MALDIYGIPNCDTVKKARNWLDQHGIAYAFHDYKKEGVDKSALVRWADGAGWEALLNRRGTTFRKLDEADRADIDCAKALALMAAHPSLIKRPVAESDGVVLVGFVPADWEAALC
jgi:Spx/MgsR family transcriptional regulator